MSTQFVAQLFLAFILTAYTPVTPPTPPAPVAPEITTAIDGAVRFLKSQYDEDLHLLEESPNEGKGNFYLTEDNALAAYALEQVGETEMASAIRAKLKEYGHESNGFIEIAWGVPVMWPPFHQPAHHEELVVVEVDGKKVRHVEHLEGLGYYYDWSAYSNLAFMGAVNELNAGNVEAARRLYEIEAGTFDGHGFADKAYWDRGKEYETLGLAWGVYAAARLCIPPSESMLASLLAQQDDAGGFHTHFTDTENRRADPNVETTSVALLALHRLANPACPSQLGLPTVQPAIAYCYSANFRAVL